MPWLGAAIVSLGLLRRMSVSQRLGARHELDLAGLGDESFSHPFDWRGIISLFFSLQQRAACFSADKSRRSRQRSRSCFGIPMTPAVTRSLRLSQRLSSLLGSPALARRLGAPSGVQPRSLRGPFILVSWHACSKRTTSGTAPWREHLAQCSLKSADSCGRVSLTAMKFDLKSSLTSIMMTLIQLIGNAQKRRGGLPGPET